MSEEEMRKEYQEYQKEVSKSVTAKDFLVLKKSSDITNTEVIRYKKGRNDSGDTDPIAIIDREGKIILSGNLIKRLYVYGFEKNSFRRLYIEPEDDEMIIKYLDSESGKEKIGIFNHCGFALIEDIEKFWDKRKMGLNIDEFYSALYKPCSILNGIYEEKGNVIELKSTFDRDRVITIEQNPYYFIPAVIYPTKILGKYTDVDGNTGLYPYHLAFYDLDRKELVEIEDSLIPPYPHIIYIHNNQVTDVYERYGCDDWICDVLYYFDDRSGTLINMEGKLTEKLTKIYRKSRHDLILRFPILKLKRPILTFSEFKKLKGKEIGIEREIEEKKEQEEKRNQERKNKKRQNEQEILNLVKRLEEKISAQQNSNEKPSYLHSIFIEEEELLVFCDDHYEISEKYVGVLRFLNLAVIDFSNVKLDHIDFRETNANINPQTCYQKDISDSLFDEGNISPFQSLQDVKASGTDFSRCRFLNLSGALIDEETKLPLYPCGEFEVLPGRKKKETQEGKIKRKSLRQNQSQ